MHNSLRPRRLAATTLVATATLLGGCATTSDGYRDPSDPLEGFNRVMYRFNSDLDTAVLKPLGRGYNAIMPAPMNRGVTNFFNNLDDIGSAVNNLLQLKVGRAVSDVGRVVVNTTVGVAGFMDVASNMDLPKYGEDFGQTLGAWGFESGPYIVLPVLGSSSIRDGVGLVADWYLDPVTYIEDDPVRWSVRGLDVVDTRADLLNASRVLEQAALDPYAFTRDAYLQRRRSLVYDGNPPPDEEIWPSTPAAQ